MAKTSGNSGVSLIAEPEVFNRQLLNWANAFLRDLPWRATRDPWSVLVSEVMLQQTQVSRVEPKYVEFLKLWPTPGHLANSALADLLVFWVGLGYPRRARNLHSAARQIRDRHSGIVPSTLPELMELPGIGPYTARAVMVFAFEMKVGVVDTNVGRLMARWSGGTLKPGAAQRLADALVPPDDPWLWNQALFDFAALVCTKKTPKCLECPVASSCSWRGTGSDPASNSAGVTGKQNKFQGSDRQARGKLMQGLAVGPIALAEAPAVMGLQDEPSRSDRLVHDLHSEGLITICNGFLLLGDSLE